MPGCAGVGQLAQIVTGIESTGHQFVRIFVIQLAQVECAKRCNAQRLGEQIRRMDRYEIIDAP